MDLNSFAFFNVSFTSVNLLSFALGAFFAAAMRRTHAFIFVVMYFISLTIYYGLMHYMSTQGANVH